MTTDASSNSLDPANIDPARLTLLLERAGWRLAGGRRGVFNRMEPPVNSGSITVRPWSLLIPLDRQAGDFSESMQAALADAATRTNREQWFTEIYPKLRTEPIDSFRFRKESSAPSGLISWKQGEELIQSARATLIAGAKSHVEHLRRFSNKFGQFASRYLDSVLMGQTAVGSYIVTAYAPIHSIIPISLSKSDMPAMPGTDSANARDVTESIYKALEATAEALDHQRRTGSYSAFDSGVREGLSYDLTVALQGITQDSEGGDISIEWDPVEPPRGSSTFVFEFSGAASAVLETASHRLGGPQGGPVSVTLSGRVHLLTKKHAGGPGVFGIETISKPTRKYRVRLNNPDQYHLAVRAHDEDLALRVSGNWEREGNINWIYHASVVGTADISEVFGEQPLL